MGRETSAEAKPLHLPPSVSLPPGWSWLRLDDASEGVFDCAHSTPKLVDVGPFVVRSQDIITGVFRPERAARVSEETYRSRTLKAAPQRGDILYSREGTYFGIAAEIPENTRICLGQRMVLIRPKKDTMDFGFLRHWLNSPIMASYIHGYRDGSVAERLNLPTIRGLPVVVPPIGEQRAVGRILGTLEEKIEQNQQMNKTLGAMARLLFKSWFVDFDPVRAKAEGRDPALPTRLGGLFPDSFEDSELGEIPKGWEVSSVGSIAEVIDCLHSKKPERCGSGLPLLQLVNIRDDGLIDMDDAYFISEDDYRMWVSRMEASPGDCVITNVGRVGAVAQMPVGQKAALGRNMTGVRCKPSFPFPTMLIEILLSKAMKNEIVLRKDSGTILDALNVRNIPKLRFARPKKLEILRYFEEKVRPVRAQMENNFAESRTLASLRDSLLPKLMSGGVRVNFERDTDLKASEG